MPGPRARASTDHTPRDDGQFNHLDA